MSKYLFFLGLSLIISVSSEAKLKSFEGNISFLRESVYDTTYISIFVKDYMVRVDEYDSRNKVISSQLINLRDEKVIALSHDKKLYLQVPVSPRLYDKTNGLEVVKTGNFKEINGRICNQWRVKNVKRNTEIAYWVFEDRYEFFASLLRLMSRTEYSLTVFNDIQDRGGAIPMLTEERTLLRKDKLRISLVQINETNLSAMLFEIPRTYKSVRR